MAQARVIARPEPARRVRFGNDVLWVRVATVLFALVAWESLARSDLFYRDVIPSSLAVADALAATLRSPAFYHHLGITFVEVLVGFVIGSAIGIASGIGLGVQPFLRRCCEPYLNAIGATPKIVFLPIIFLMFGVGIESKMAKGALSGFFPTVFATTLGVMLVSPVLIRVGRSFKLSTLQMVTKIYLPAMVGPVIVGLRLGLGVSIIGILVAEIKFSDGGLGYLLINHYDQFKIAPMYAIMVILFALAALANWGMTKLQDRFTYGPSVGGEALRQAPR